MSLTKIVGIVILVIIIAIVSVGIALSLTSDPTGNSYGWASKTCAARYGFASPEYGQCMADFGH